MVNFAAQLMNELREKEGCVRDPDNILRYKIPLEKCNHKEACIEEKGNWLCEKCMCLFGHDPRQDEKINK